MDSLSISQYMTASPISIEARAGIREADALMTANQFRHLPVVREGELIGILSDRDIHLAQGLHGIDLESVRVEDVAKTDLYTVTPSASLDEVASVMAQRRIGSAIVVEDGRVVGIFTTTNALEALSCILRK